MSEREVTNMAMMMNAERDYRQIAGKKLTKEMEAAKDKGFAKPVLTYLIKRCAEDKGLSEDVMQRHKTWEKCLAYIYGKAKKQAVDNRAVVEDHIVYEWAEDYYHKDDRAEEMARLRKEAEQKAKRSQAPAAKGVAAPNRDPVQKAAPKKKGVTEGQMDLFSLMGAQA